MNEKYELAQWVVQRNLTSQSDFENLKNACLAIAVEFIGLNIIPFTEQLPDFDKSRRSIIYGSTTFNRLAFEDPDLKEGVFFDADTFSIQNYIKHWGAYMLNAGASVTTFGDLVNSMDYNADQLLFIRPDDDNKSFSGEVKRFNEIKDWYTKVREAGNTMLEPDTKIIVAEPYNIRYEWRLWIVKGKVIAASKYREYFKLQKEAGCPDGVIRFAEERCLQFTPHDVFVMDVCECGDEYFIVECRCMNGTGFYKTDIGKIVSSVTDYFVYGS